MKKLFFLTAAFFLISFASVAQLKVGVKGGPSITKYRGTPTNAVFGFHLGVFGNIAFTDNLSFEPELMYSKQGAKADYFDNFFRQEGTVRDHLSYLSVPLLLKFNTNFGLTFESGVQLSYLLKGTSKYKFPDNVSGVTRDDLDLKKSEILKDSDFSFLIGAGYELPSGLSVNFRSAIGLSNIDQNSEYYNMVYQLSVGFPLIAL